VTIGLSPKPRSNVYSYIELPNATGLITLLTVWNLCFPRVFNQMNEDRAAWRPQ